MLPRELSESLAKNAESVAQMLLPEGRRVGAEWRAGSVSGERGDSLGVHLTGAKAGVWADFASGESGDLIDLWSVVRNLSMRETLGEVRDYLGVRSLGRDLQTLRQYERPEKPKCKAACVDGKAGGYLQSRGISQKTMDAYSVAENAKGEIVLPSLRDGELIAAKFLQIERDEKGKKRMRVLADCEPCLFGWQAISDSTREVMITEGEVDAMSAYQLGFPALSVPFGGGGGDKQRWIGYEFDNLARFDVIYLALDNDAAGQEASKVIADRLGAERCRTLSIPKPHKDVNDLLQSGMNASEFNLLTQSALSQDPEELRQASCYLDQVLSSFYPAEEEEVGVKMPWAKMGALLLRPGELSILAGINGHGKSQIAGQITLEAMRQEFKCCVASMEFQAWRWLTRLTKQSTALGRPHPDVIRGAHEWYQDRLWVFDVVGTAKSNRILDVFAYARRRYGITFFVIDNLAKCGIAEDDYRGQKDFVDSLTDFVKVHQAHVVLLHHMRKSQDEKNQSGKMDIKGTGAITDMADTVLTIWRNKTRERAIEAGEPGAEMMPSARFACEKQRNGDAEPVTDLWFDSSCYQYIEAERLAPVKYVGIPKTYQHPKEVYF